MKKILVILFLLLSSCSPVTASPAASPVAAQFSSPETPQAIFINTAPGIASLSIFSQSVGTTSELLQEIQDIARQRWGEFVSQPGWLYRRTRIEGPAREQFFTWEITPNQYEQEEWLLLDGEGKITAGASEIVDAKGNLVRTLYLEDGNWIDLTAGSMSPVENEARVDLDYGIPDLASSLVQQGRQLYRSTIYNGCWYQGEKYTISDEQNYYEVVFNPHRKSLRWIKTYHIVEGSIVLMDSLEMMIEERISEPPAEILALLDQPAVP